MERAWNNTRSNEGDEHQNNHGSNLSYMKQESLDILARETRHHLARAPPRTEVNSGTFVCDIDDGSAPPLRAHDEFKQAPKEKEAYSCAVVGCRWPCEHHIHDKQCRDFSWIPDGADATYTGCQYCSVLVGISKSYCACHRRLEKGSCGLSHACKRISVHFEGNSVSYVDLFSTCGSIDLELGFTRECELGEKSRNEDVFSTLLISIL